MGKIVLAVVTVMLSAVTVVAAEYEMIDLGTIGGRQSFAAGINNRGQIVGSSDTPTNQTHGFLWEDGAMIDLGALGGNFSCAGATNSRGQVVGASFVDSTFNHAFLWKEGVMEDLGTLIFTGKLS